MGQVKARRVRSIHEVLEEQVRRWQVEKEELDSRGRRDGGLALRERPNVVTIATAVGARGSTVARLVGEALGIPVYDREVVQHIAQTAHVQVATVETLNQRARGRIDDYLASLFRERNFDQGDYLKVLTRTILALWEHGPCVIVGHGSIHLVDRRHALMVRTIAPEADRIQRMMDTAGLGREEARSEVRRIDAERASFHERFFHAQLADPLQFDVIVNTSALGVNDSAALIVDAFRRKFPHARPHGPPV